MNGRSLSRERQTKDSTHGTSKEATGTVTKLSYCDDYLVLEVLDDGRMYCLVCTIITKQHTAYRQHAYQLLHAYEFGFLFLL